VTRSVRRWLLTAVAGLAAAWIVAPAAVPIYDGLSNPDEPYRYVVAPPWPHLKQNGPPTNAVGQVAVRNGRSGAAYVNSHESGPQVSIYVPPGALRVPAGATQITVTATPLAPSAPLPRDGTIWTNVYHVSAAAGGSQDVPVVGRGALSPTIQMRAPSAQQPGPVFEHRTSTGWQQLKTLRVGNDVYQAQAPTFGDWALVRLAHPATADSGGSGPNVGLLAAGIAVLVVVGAIVAIRFSRTRRANA
jgi:hypothetical protein